MVTIQQILFGNSIGFWDQLDETGPKPHCAAKISIRLINIAQIALLALELVDVGRGTLHIHAAVLGNHVVQGLIDILRHAAGIATNIEMAAILQPGIQLLAVFPHAGLHVPTGEVRCFPKNTSDALTSGGTYAIAGAVERMYQHLAEHCGAEPMCIMAGGAGWKMSPSMTRPFELINNLIFDGLLVMAEKRWG